VSLPESMVPELASLTFGKAADEALFVGPKGARLRENNFRDRVWKRAITAANADRDEEDHFVPRELRLNKQPRIHDLRHTHASWLISAGVDLPTVQRRLGHESITTTVDRYGHLDPDQLKRASDATNAALLAATPL
jgi:integrase